MRTCTVLTSYEVAANDLGVDFGAEFRCSLGRPRSAEVHTRGCTPRPWPCCGRRWLRLGPSNDRIEWRRCPPIWHHQGTSCRHRLSRMALGDAWDAFPRDGDGCVWRPATMILGRRVVCGVGALLEGLVAVVFNVQEVMADYDRQWAFCGIFSCVDLFASRDIGPFR